MRNQRKKERANTLVFAIALTLIQPIFSQSMPQSLAAQINSQSMPEFYELGQFEKARTQYDGVTLDQTVNYLKMTRDTGVQIPVMSTVGAGTDEPTDFTVMMWFKFYAPIEGQDIMQLFSFPKSAACFITSSFTLMCDTAQRKKLQISSEQLKAGVWYHLTLSIPQNGVAAYLLLQNNSQGVLARDVNDRSSGAFSFVQDAPSQWQACLGDCYGNLGLEGGIREVVMLNSYITEEDAIKAKNMQFTYSNAFKAYFRFKDNGRFERDEFIDRTWAQFKPANMTDYIGLDLIPNDVCPTSYEQKRYIKFNADKVFTEMPLTTPLVRDNYEYSFSMSFKATGTSCFTKNPTAAAMFCNVVLVHEVFMVYFENINMMKVYFFASKNYYESASKAFFVPTNQWVTLQLTLSRFNGFDLAVADQNGKIFYRQTESGRNMQTMLPANKVSLFDSFQGYVDHLMICPSAMTIGRSKVAINKKRKDCIFNLSFDEDSIKRGELPNFGSNPVLVLPEQSTLDYTLYQGQETDTKAGTFDAKPMFDGIACNDGHMTLMLQKGDSYFRFNTPSFDMWQSESTIEFWFKLSEKAAYTSQDKFYLLSMRDSGGKYPYYEVYVQNGVLTCAPFGSLSINDVRLSFSQFSLENEDQFGWWHVSCSYSFQKLTRATLYNKNVNSYQTSSLVGQSSFYPQDSLFASFGLPAQSSPNKGALGLLIKEVRYWSVQLSQERISMQRYKQIDPTLPQNTGTLLTYLRLASGDLKFINLAELNLDNQYAPTKFQFNGVKFVPDFFQTVTYYYDVVKAKVLQKADRTYHTVCPLYTYYLNKYCYSEPINQLALTIFPVKNDQTKSVDWEFSVLNSSAIDTSIILSLSSMWETNDSYLQQFFNSLKDNFSFILPGSYLRHESEYEISVSITNEQNTFTESITTRFVPSKCKWYEVVKSDAKNSYQVFGSLGTNDIKFELELQTNSAINCSSFSFFDQVADIGFEFILSDTNEYITVPPEVQFTVGEKGKITIIIPAAEQTKLPLFKDIKILASLRWRNSALNSEEDSLVFQTVMLTVKFEPTDSVLVANLIASANEITRGETLILDATSSYITNVPENMKTRGISYQWICPEEFKSYCQGQTDGQLVIPFQFVTTLQQKSPGSPIFKRAFLFTAVISWDKPNSEIEVDKLSSQVMFWDINAPQFEITYSPQPVLITDVKNTVFSIASANFDVNNLEDYNIIWTISPPLPNMNEATVLRSGALYQVNKRAWSAKTDYTVTALVSHKAIQKLNQEKSVQFRTEIPPADGLVIVSPQSAKIGQDITVSIDGWTSDNQPVVFNVYNTLDTEGSRRGLLLNVGAPISASDKFKFVLRDSNPIQVEVTDQSKETVQFIEVFQIIENSVAESEDSTPDQLLVQLRKSTDATEKVNLIDKVLEKSLQSSTTTVANEKAQTTFLIDTSSQILIRQSLVQAIADQIKIYDKKVTTQDMTVEDFMLKTVPLLQSATSIPEFIDFKTAQLITSVIDLLIELKPNAFFGFVQTDLALRNSYIGLLQNINAIAMNTNPSKVQGWVNDRVEDLMDKMCAYQSLEQGYKSPASTEFEFQLYQFDKSAALQGRKATVEVLDSKYELSAANIYSQYPSSQQPGQLCTQVLGIKLQPTQKKRTLATAKINPYSQSVTSVSIFEVNSAQKRQVGELTGQVVLKFDIVPNTFRNNQTVCMAFSKDKNTWDANLCNSELQAESLQMKCTCNAFKSDLTSLFTDTSRQLDPSPIVFPEIKPLKMNVELQTNLQVKTKSNVWLWSSTLLSVVLLVATGIAFRLDLSDNAQTNQKLARTQNAEVSFGSSNGGLNHFVLEVSRELHQPYAEVNFRRRNLVTYRNVCPNSVFLHALSQIHPAAAPFISYFAIQSRLFRFSAYALQVNIFAILVSCYFNRMNYRLASIRFDDSMIDQVDIKNITVASLIGSLVLLPFLSEPLCTLLSDAIARVVNQDVKYMDEIQVEVKKQRVIPRAFVIALGIATTLIAPIWAGIEGGKTPSSNQFCILTTLMGGLILSILLTSNLYVGYNSTVAKLMQKGRCGRFSVSHWFVCHKALRIAQDLKAVQEASKLFTLSDVLPSSLENSERSLQARRVSTQNNKTDSDKESEVADQVIYSETGRDKINQQIDLSNANVEDSMTRHPGNPNSMYQVRNKRGRLQKIDNVQKVNQDEISGNSLTYTEYKAKLGVTDGNQKQVRQNNYINRRGSSDSSKMEDCSNATSIACNEQERSQQESSQAEYIANDRSRSYRNEEMSNCISQNVSFLNNHPDISRNDILPIRGVGSESSASAHSELSDIRGIQIERSQNSSMNHEARIHAEPKPRRL